MAEQQHKTRRDFLKIAGATTLAVGATATLLQADAAERLEPGPFPDPSAPADPVRLGLIGAGIIGFIDTDTALNVPGVTLVAAADCYDSRLARVKEVYGPQIDTTRDYQAILARDDVDAVIVATPDHWHTQIATEALQAGKGVYLEKPMVHKVEEGHGLIDAVKQTNGVLQVGSQFASNIIFKKAKALYESGAIGTLTGVTARMNRNSSIGAWQYSIPPDASAQNVDWQRFLGDAPDRPFDPMRFFRWRNYQDYGTGVAGDLFVHLLTGIHLVLGSHGPTSVVSRGGIRFWEDGRDVPDMMVALFDYPETDSHPDFTLSLEVNFADGGGGGTDFRFVGSDGVISTDFNSLTLMRNPRRPPSEEAIVEGYNSVRTFSTATQEKFVQHFRANTEMHSNPSQMRETRTFQAPEGYDGRLEHFHHFFDGVRKGTPIFEDATYGFRAAAPTLLANMSFFNNQIYGWDPEKMVIVDV